MRWKNAAVIALVALGAASVARSADERRVVQPVTTIFTDERDRWVGVSVWTDPATGCDYLLGATPGGAITPRLKADGLPFCRTQ